MTREINQNTHAYIGDDDYDAHAESMAFGLQEHAYTGALETHIALTVDDARNVNQDQPCGFCCYGNGKRRRRRSLPMNWMKHLTLTLVLAGFLVYVGAAVYLNPRRAIFICVVTPFVGFGLVNALTRGVLWRCVGGSLRRVKKALAVSRKASVWLRRVCTVVAVLGILVFLVLDIWDDVERWQPLGGLALFVLLSVVFSKHPSKIDWVTVAWGLILQFCMGLLILRWEVGFRACRWLGSQVTNFLGFTDSGTKFVFGEKYTDHPVVFKILPVVIFYGAVVSCLYYAGAMQAIIKSIAALIQFAMKTTPIESFATAAQIFFGMVEATVTLRPFFPKLTVSEIHAIMTSGYATVAGTMIAAYVEFGVAAEHVISASFMSAPAALAIAKLSIPETEKSEIKTLREIQVPKGQESNIIEALSVGATNVIKLLAYIVVNVIAFVAVLSFLDAVLSYLGSLVNYPDISFQLISSYIFMPLAASMGVPWSETKVVSALIGKKLVINEFLAFADLGALIKKGALSEKASVLATYILCGFGSIAALGINLGCLASSCPERRADFARLSLRSLVNGNIACFMTTCIAGLLYQDFSHDSAVSLVSNVTSSLNSSFANATESFIQ